MLRPGIPHAFRLALRGRNRLARAVRDEIEMHLDMLAEHLEREGLSPDAARAEALRRFGPPDEVHRRLYAAAQFREERMHLREWADSVRHDVRYALRQLTRAPYSQPCGRSPCTVTPNAFRS